MLRSRLFDIFTFYILLKTGIGIDKEYFNGRVSLVDRSTFIEGSQNIATAMDKCRMSRKLQKVFVDWILVNEKKN